MASDQDTPVRPSCSPPCMTSSDPMMPDDVVILDFSKAFDTVPYNKVLYKLDHYSVRGPVHTWITNFLTSRKMRVVLEGETSEEVAQCKVPCSSCATSTTCQRPWSQQYNSLQTSAYSTRKSAPSRIASYFRRIYTGWKYGQRYGEWSLKHRSAAAFLQRPGPPFSAALVE